ARVVLDDVDDPETAVDRGGRALDLQGRRTREDAAGHRGVEHAPPDEARVQRLVAGTAAREHADLIRAIVVRAHDEARVAVPAHERGVCAREPGERLVDDVAGVVDEVAPGAHALGAVGHGRSSSWAGRRMLARPPATVYPA